jgi:hypothetical protein
MIISIVGPLSSLLIGIILMAFLFLPINFYPIFSVTMFYSAISNIGLGFFNLIPAFPIDGGRILRAILWKRRNNLLSATKSSSRVGTYIGYGIMAYGFIQILFSGIFSGIWLILIGNFLASTARKAYYQTRNDVILSNITVKEMLSIPDLAIPFSTTLDIALKDYFFRYKKSIFPVNKGYEVVGVVDIQDIKKIPAPQRSEKIVGYLMKNISEFPSIDQKQSGKVALSKLNKIDKGPMLLIVKESEKFVGFLGKNELLSSLEFWSAHMTNNG